MLARATNRWLKKRNCIADMFIVERPFQKHWQQTADVCLHSLLLRIHTQLRCENSECRSEKYIEFSSYEVEKCTQSFQVVLLINLNMRVPLRVGNVALSPKPSVKSAIHVCSLIHQQTHHRRIYAAVSTFNRPLLTNWTRIYRQNRSASWLLDSRRSQAAVVSPFRSALTAATKPYNMLHFFGEFII